MCVFYNNLFIITVLTFSVPGLTQKKPGGLPKSALPFRRQPLLLSFPGLEKEEGDKAELGEGEGSGGLEQ